MRGLAKTPSPSIGYGLVRLQRRRSSAMYSSIVPTECKEFADPQPGCGIEKRQGALSNRQLAKEKLEFVQFQNIRNLLSFRALAQQV
jgi:hypothetical protein